MIVGRPWDHFSNSWGVKASDRLGARFLWETLLAANEGWAREAEITVNVTDRLRKFNRFRRILDSSSDSEFLRLQETLNRKETFGWFELVKKWGEGRNEEERALLPVMVIVSDN